LSLFLQSLECVFKIDVGFDCHFVVCDDAFADHNNETNINMAVEGLAG